MDADEGVANRGQARKEIALSVSRFYFLPMTITIFQIGRGTLSASQSRTPLIGAVPEHANYPPPRWG